MTSNTTNLGVKALLAVLGSLPADVQALAHRSYALLKAGSDFVFAFHDGEEIGPRMLARIAKHTGLTPEDL